MRLALLRAATVKIISTKASVYSPSTWQLLQHIVLLLHVTACPQGCPCVSLLEGGTIPFLLTAHPWRGEGVWQNAVLYQDLVSLMSAFDGTSGRKAGNVALWPLTASGFGAAEMQGGSRLLQSETVQE